MRTGTQHGFSLIELMIAVAIIGVLAAAAIPAYRNYIESSNMTKVASHYRQGIRFVESEYRRLRTEIAIGTLTATQADADYTAATWIEALNGEGGKAPDGSDAYAEDCERCGGRRRRGDNGDILIRRLRRHLDAAPVRRLRGRGDAQHRLGRCLIQPIAGLVGSPPARRSDSRS